MSKTFNYIPIVGLQHIVCDNKICSAVAGMCIVNDDSYVICSYSDKSEQKQPLIFHKLYNYISDINNGTYNYNIIQTQNGSQNIAVHANSITYHNHLFYIVTRNGIGKENQVMAIKSDGIIREKLKYPNKKIATINYYGNGDEFIISVSGGMSIDYRLTKKNGKYLEDILKFKINIPKEKSEYDIGNDSYYDIKTKKLYVTKFKKSDLTSNAIFVYDLSDLKNGKEYNPIDRYYIKPKYGENKFEIEGLSIYNGDIYVCTNSVIGNIQVDGVYKLI